jgi:hypothetical protein
MVLQTLAKGNQGSLQSRCPMHHPRRIDHRARSESSVARGGPCGSFELHSSLAFNGGLRPIVGLGSVGVCRPSDRKMECDPIHPQKAWNAPCEDQIGIAHSPKPNKTGSPMTPKSSVATLKGSPRRGKAPRQRPGPQHKSHTAN